MMALFVDARDHVSGALMATLPTEMLPPMDEPHPPGLARQLRASFVAAGRLTLQEAETVDFELRQPRAARRR